MATYCKVPDCARANIAAKGLCWGHYQRLRRHGEVGTGQVRRHVKGGRDCSVPGCPRKSKARGYCDPHLYRLSKGLPPDYSPYRRGRCRVPTGCVNNEQWNGMCNSHVAGWLQGKLVVLDMPRPECKIPDCQRPQRHSGICSGHYSRKVRGVPLNNKPLRRTSIRPVVVESLLPLP